MLEDAIFASGRLALILKISHEQMSYLEMSCNEVLSYNEMSCYKMFWNVMIVHMYFLMCRNKYLTISIDVLYLVFIYLILCIEYLGFIYLL